LINLFRHQKSLESSTSVWGDGITSSMKNDILKLLNQGQAFHGSDYEKHSKYIKD
jgi:hypothetical protein